MLLLCMENTDNVYIADDGSEVDDDSGIDHLSSFFVSRFYS